MPDASWNEVPTAALEGVPAFRTGGFVDSYQGGTVAARGLAGRVAVGDACTIELGRRTAARDPRGSMLAEVVGFNADLATLVPYGEPEGIVAGARVVLEPSSGLIHPDPSWLGRVIDALGRPADGGPPLRQGVAVPVRRRAPPAGQRRSLGPRQALGVRALDLFTPCCEGQRIGIFAGSGVGKSSLLSMIARGSAADALVIGLIGERGRELGEFLRHGLGEAGRARSVVVVSTSDEPAMLRRRAAYTTLAVAEALRDQGLNVLCLVDSVTRFAMALREIFLAAGEVPTSRGYPPSVFAELPRLLERAGPATEGCAGSITGLFTVLVDGDDMNEPVSDAVRGILDGHVVLDRAIAEGGRFPAVDVLKSLSRTAPGCYAADERALVREARAAMRTHADMAELIQLGAYKPGTSAEVDRAVALRPALEGLLRQEIDEPAGGDPFASLASVLRPA